MFVTTAVSSGQPDPKIRVGNYGDVGSVDDTSKHTWQVLCLDRDTGKILWTQTAYEGVPKIKRHLKGSQANCTPATDGKHVVACFGSEGLYCYDFDGKLLWKRDLGTLDSSFAIDQEYEWGFGSSPVIHDGAGILQCDLSRDSFIAAFSLEDGSKVWSTPRDEIPSWSTPVVWRNAEADRDRDQRRPVRPRLRPGDRRGAVAAGQEVGGDGPDAGARQGPDLHHQRQPADPADLRDQARGDRRHLAEGGRRRRTSSVAWSTLRGGPYMPTPILYGPTCTPARTPASSTCYEAATGKEVYKERLGGGELHGVAGGGRRPAVLHLRAGRGAGGEGRAEVRAAGGQRRWATYCMATPAISSGALFVRTQHFLFALGPK